MVALSSCREFQEGVLALSNAPGVGDMSKQVKGTVRQTERRRGRHLGSEVGQRGEGQSRARMAHGGLQGSGLGVGGVLALQRTVGNRAVSQLFESRSPALDGDSPVRRVVGGTGGRPLEPRLRSEMERSFGASFSSVRVHSDARAAASARSIGASAYTVGDHVVLGTGDPTAATASDRHVLAHELTHVLQQRSGPVSGTPVAGGMSLSDPSDRFEMEAERVAQRVVSGEAVQVPSAASGSGAAGVFEGQLEEATAQRITLFGKKDPAKEEQKRRTAEARKLGKKQARANKRAEAGVTKRQKQERKENDAAREKLAQQVSGGVDKTDASANKRIADQFEAKLQEEADRVEALKARGFPDDAARDQAYADIWLAAPPDLRAIRPMRETAAERNQRDVDKFRSEYKATATSREANSQATALGTLLEPKIEELYDRVEARIQALVAQGIAHEQAEKQATDEVWGQAPEKLRKKRPSPGSPLDVTAREDARKRLAAQQRLAPKAKKGVGGVAATVTGTVATGSAKVASELGKVSKGSSDIGTAISTVQDIGKEGLGAVIVGDSESKAKSLVGLKGPSPDAGNGVAALEAVGQQGAVAVFAAGSDFTGNLQNLVGGISKLFGSVNGLVRQVNDYTSGDRTKIDIHEVSKAVNNAVGIVDADVGELTELVKICGEFSTEVASAAAMFVPGLGIGIALSNAIQLAFQLASLSTRLGQVNIHLFQARARGADPSKVDALVNPMIKLQSSFTKKVEKVSFDLSATLVKLASSIVELATAPAYGAGIIADKVVKSATLLLQGAHSLAHKVADDVLAWQGQQAHKAYVGREIGSAEELQRTKATYAVDALIVRARSGDDVALSYLRTFNLNDEQIKTWDGGKLHKRIMGDAGEKEDPTTTYQQFTSGFEKITSAIEAVGEKGGDVRALREARNAADGKQRGMAWEAKMFVKALLSSRSFERSKRKTEVETGKPLHQQPEGPAVSAPELTGGTFGGIVSIAKGVVLTARSDEKTQARWSKAVSQMSLEELQAAAKAPYHDDEMKAFFSGWVDIRQHEQALRRSRKQLVSA